MNQILSTSENNYKPKKAKSNNELLDMRKIIIVFSALIIIFSLVIVGAKAYGMIKEKNKEKDKQNPANQPIINITRVEDECILNIEYGKGIQKISYWWNEGDVEVKNVNGSTKQVFPIQIPSGNNNMLYVTVNGSDGSFIETKQVFSVESTKPNISWTYNKETAEITIVATSDKGIKNIKYKWENDEQETVREANEGETVLRITIPVERGINSIHITATDIEGNIQEKNEKIQGILKPEIEMRLENGNTLKLNIRHDMGFKKVIIKINGQEKTYDENSPQYNANITEINVNTQVPQGRLDVEVWVYTLEQPEEEYYEHKWANV